jgi:hypothetical protein
VGPSGPREKAVDSLSRSLGNQPSGSAAATADDSHVDSHGDTTRYESVEPVDATHERGGPQTPPDDAMNAEHPDF